MKQWTLSEIDEISFSLLERICNQTQSGSLNWILFIKKKKKNYKIQLGVIRKNWTWTR